VNYQSQVGSLSTGSSYSGGYSAAMPSAFESDAYKSGMLTNSSYTSNSISGNTNSYGSGLGMRNTKSTKNENGGGASGITLTGFGKRGSSEVSNQTSVGGGFGGSLSSTTGSTGGVMQRGAAEDENPLDPGGDPNGNPLPLNGEWVLIVLAAGYIALKALKKQH
jgi:hypothetical protein